jgi:hypothetical protein
VTGPGFLKAMAAILVAGAGALVWQGDTTRAWFVVALAMVTWLASFVPDEEEDE